MFVGSYWQSNSSDGGHRIIAWIICIKEMFYRLEEEPCWTAVAVIALVGGLGRSFPLGVVDAASFFVEAIPDYRSVIEDVAFRSDGCLRGLRRSRSRPRESLLLAAIISLTPCLPPRIPRHRSHIVASTSFILWFCARSLFTLRASSAVPEPPSTACSPPSGRGCSGTISLRSIAPSAAGPLLARRRCGRWT